MRHLQRNFLVVIESTISATAMAPDYCTNKASWCEPSFLFCTTMNLLSKFLVLFFLYIFTVESADPVYYFCNDNSKTNSSNINGLLSKLVSGTIKNGFVATSEGAGSDKIYGLAQCRGDVDSTSCSSCIKDAEKSILELCPQQADARIWYDFCFMRYSNVKFFGEVDTSGLYLYNVENVTDASSFNNKLGTLMKGISSEATKLGNKGLGKGTSDISSFLTLYALAQCTRDLSELSCGQCISIAISNFPTVCGDKKGCRVLYSSCYVRYELYPFFFPVNSGKSSDYNSLQNYKMIMDFKQQKRGAITNSFSDPGGKK